MQKIQLHEKLTSLLEQMKTFWSTSDRNNFTHMVCKV